MVSIPDWSRFRRGPPPPPSPQGIRRLMTPRERYIRAMEKEAINEASRKGYFLEPTKDMIIEEFGDTHGAEDPKTGLPLQKQMWHVNHIRFTHQHMKVLGDIELFTRITILILDHNYLDNIDALVACTELIKLDIHSNQISILPEGMFWSQLQNLRILIAHDNPVAKVEAVHSLAACPRLQLLTLYDSPLALKKNYRHHVVNILWSLEVLDHHVISDEEIIEDATFAKTRFRTLSKAFEVELCPSHPKPGASFEDELISIRNVIRKVNKIMSHFCPVLIIQKNVRMWLIHRRYKIYTASRHWAAVTIQKAWKVYKNIYPPSRDSTDLDTILAPTYLSIPAPMMRTASKPSNQVEAKDSVTRSRQASHARMSERSEMTSAGSGRRARLTFAYRKGLIIDLHKLQGLSQRYEDSLNLPNILAQAHMMTPKKVVGKIPGYRNIPTPPQPPGKRPITHQKQFFGPLITDLDYTPVNHQNCLPSTLPQSELSYVEQSLPAVIIKNKQTMPANILRRALENNDEVPKIAFRLEGKKQHVKHIDKFEDVILTKKEHGQDVRDVESQFHEFTANLPPHTRIRKEANLKDKFMYERAHQTMNLSALMAVQQAYRDRDLDEKRAAKMRSVMDIKERREISKERVKAFQEEKKLLAVSHRQEFKKFLNEANEENEKQTAKEVNKSLMNRERLKAFKKERESQLRFALEFRTQQTSVSKALIKHDRQLQIDAKLQNKMEKVEALKDLEREQQDIVKKYLKHRQIMRQSENAMQKAALDTRMLQDANDRVYEAKSRVEQMKTRQDNAKQYLSLPPTAITAPNLPTGAILTPLNTAENIKTKRKKTSKSMFQFYVPSSTRDDMRAETRLTLSGGISRIHPTS